MGACLGKLLAQEDSREIENLEVICEPQTECCVYVVTDSHTEVKTE